MATTIQEVVELKWPADCAGLGDYLGAYAVRYSGDAERGGPFHGGWSLEVFHVVEPRVGMTFYGDDVVDDPVGYMEPVEDVEAARDLLETLAPDFMEEWLG